MSEMLPDAVPEPPQPDHSGGVMIALKVPDPHAYAVPEGTPPEDLHVTLVYLGKANELSPEQKNSVVQAAQEAAARFGRPPQAMFPYDYGTFRSEAPEGSPFVLHPLGDDLDELYSHVCNSLKEHGLGDRIAADHAFNPHVTLKYLQDGESTPHAEYSPPNMSEISFPTMRVSVGDDEHPISLSPTAERPIRPQQVLSSVEERLHNLVQDHNLSATRGTRVSLPMLKAVYSREFQDALPSSSQSLTASALNRCAGFLTALSSRNARHSDADLFPCAVPVSPFERTLRAAVTSGSDRIKSRLLDSAVSASQAERTFNLSRALHAAASSTSPRVQLELTEPLRALLADGQSSAARSMRAKLQLRDRHGRWIDMGKGIRFKVHAPGAAGSGTWYHGRVEGQDVPNGLLSVRLEDGRLVQVPADKVEQPAAILGLEGEHLNRTPDANLDPHAPVVADLPEISNPTHAQEPVGAGDIRSLLDRVQTRIHDTFRDARPQEKDPVARMMAAVGQATRDLQNPNTQALDQASSWIDQFLRDNPNLSVTHRNDLLYAQDTFRNMTPVLNNYEHDSRNFTPDHPVQRGPDERPRPFRRFTNGRAQDDPNAPARHREIEPAGERVTVPSLEAPEWPDQNGNPRRGEDIRRYLRDDYGINSSFLPGANGRPDLKHVSITGDKAHVKAALEEIWGLARDDAGNVVPLPDPGSRDHGDAGVIPNVEAAIRAVQAAHPGLAFFAEQLQHELDVAGPNPSPQQLQELADELDGAKQALDIMLQNVDPEFRDGVQAARDALDDAASNAWGGARPERLPLPPSSFTSGPDAPNRDIVGEMRRSAEENPPTPEEMMRELRGTPGSDPIPAVVQAARDAGISEEDLAYALSHRSVNAADAGHVRLLDRQGNGTVLPGITPEQFQAVSTRLNGAMDRGRRQRRGNADANVRAEAQRIVGENPQAAPASPVNATQDLPNRAIADQLDKVLDALGDMEDANVPGIDFQNVRDMVNDVVDSHQDNPYPPRELRLALDEVFSAVDQNLVDAGITPDHMNDTQEGAYDRWRGQMDQVVQIAEGNVQVAPGDGTSSPAPSEPALTPPTSPDVRDQFGGDVPIGFNFDQEILNQGARVQLYNHTASDGRSYQVGVRPQRYGGQPQYVIRQGTTHNGERRWHVLNSQEDWSGVLNHFQQVEADNEQHRQGEANRARLAEQAAQEDARVQANHQAAVAENVDDAGHPLPTGWTRHLDEANGTYYQDGAGNMVMSTGAPDHGLALYARNHNVGGRERLGIYDNWGSVHTALTAHDRDQQRAVRSNILVALDHNGVNLSDEERQGILDAPNQQAIRDLLANNAEYQAIRRRGADAQQADVMQDHERAAYNLDNQIQGVIRRAGDVPAAPGTGEDSPATGPIDEAGRRLPPEWGALPGDDARIGQMYMGPGGATAYVDTNRPGNPITVGFENQAGEARQVTNLPDWGAVSELLTQVDRGIIPSNAERLPGETSGSPDNVDEHNARLDRDRETGFRDSLYHTLVQVGVPPQVAGQIYDMHSADQVKNFVSGIPEVRDVLAGVAEQDADSVNPVDQRNANLLNRGINMVQDLPDSAAGPDVANLPIGDNSRAFLDVADGLDAFLRERIGLTDEELNQILDDPTAAIDLIEADPRVRNVRTNAADGNEHAIEMIQELDRHEQALREALAGNAAGDDMDQPGITPGPPEGSPGNPNDVLDSGERAVENAAAPAARVGAPPGYENRYHPDGVIQDRLGRQIKRGDRVVSRRDGADVIGTVVAVQQHPPYARIQWPDGRRQVRAGARLNVVQPAQVPGFNAPAAPAAPAAPGVDARAVTELPDAAPAAPAGNAQDLAQEIANMHVAGAQRGFPLLTNVGAAKTHVNNALARITEGDRAGATNQISAAVNQYQVAMQTPDFARQTPEYKADVARRMELAQALHQNLFNADFPLERPNAVNAINALAALRQAIPTRAPRGQARDNVHRRYRYGGFAIDDALPLLRNGNLAEAETALNRAMWSFRQGNRQDLADQVQAALNDLRAAGLAPSNAPAPNVPVQFGDVPEPRDFIANRFPGDRAPVAAGPETPGVRDPRDGQDNMIHPQAPNPAATQADYADWGARGAEIAQAARIRPSVAAITTATGEEQSRLIREAFGGLDGITFGRNGYKITFTGSGSLGHLSVSGTVWDANGNRVGSINRSMNGTGAQWTAYNSSMSLSRDAQSTGFANAVNRYFENWYIANGFQQVTVSAAGSGGYTGGFAWAMNGFGWKDPFNHDATGALAALERSTRAGSPEAQVVAQLKARMESARRNRNADMIPTPMELALVGWAPGKTNWVGKTTMRNQSWGGKKVLQPTSVNWQQRQSYEIANKAAARVDNQENAFNVNRPFANSIADMSAPGLREAGITPVEAEQIAKIMRSQNPSAAQLPFTTKRKLSNWANVQATHGNWNSDIENVANTLQNELMADYPKEDSLGIGQQLQGYGLTAFSQNQVDGFTVRKLGEGESGINQTFLVTHDASGQTFFVKKDVGIYGPMNTRILTPGATAENDVNALLRQMNWPGIDVAQSQHVDGGAAPVDQVEAMVVQHRVGDNLDLVARPRAAGDVGAGPSGEAFSNLAQHDQLIRMLLLDGLLGNPDRHGKNFMVGQGSDSRWWIFPIDHGLARTPVDGAERVDPVESLRMTILRGERLFGSQLKAYADAMGEANLRNLLQNILRDYRTGVSQPGIFKSNDFSSKMSQNIDLMERRIDEIIQHLLRAGRRR